MPPATLPRCLFCGETFSKYGDNYCSFRCRKQGLKQAMFEAKADREIEAAGQESQQWISVADRLPEPSEYVLLNCEAASDLWPAGIYRGYLYRLALIDRYSTQTKQGWNVEGLSLGMHIVTHWQPLPAPPPVEQVAEQEPKIGFCKDCRHWEAISNGTSYRRCTLHNRQEVDVWLQCGGFVHTRYNFGCVAFLPFLPRENAKE